MKSKSESLENFYLEGKIEVQRESGTFSLVEFN